MQGLPKAALAAALVASCGVESPPPALADTAVKRAVVVELFTSEGCSSCPSADAVMRRLEREQGVRGAEILPLELHVDYWNGLGWSDPFSKAAYSQRQGAYARAFGARGSYTPQMVIDGARELIGSNESGAKRAIAESATQPKAKVTLRPDGARVKVDVEGATGGGDVLVAITESGLSTHVPRGENAGETLPHGPVVRDLASLGAVANGAFSTTFQPRLDAAWKRENVRVVVFVQRANDLKIAGAAAIAAR